MTRSLSSEKRGGGRTTPPFISENIRNLRDENSIRHRSVAHRKPNYVPPLLDFDYVIFACIVKLGNSWTGDGPLSITQSQRMAHA